MSKDNTEAVRSAISESVEVLTGLDKQVAEIDALCERVVETFLRGGCIYTAGNGGSAAEALHMTEELVGRFRGDRRSLPAVCLVADPTALTCIANDYGYEEIFSRAVSGLGRPGDLLMLLSTSGNSANLVRAAAEARRKDVCVACLLGRDGGLLAGTADLEIIVNSRSTERIQEAHQLIIHIIMDAVERAFT